MRPRPTPALFLQQKSYRRRRVRDAVRLLPFLGLILLAIPLAWGGEGGTEIGTNGLIYVFSVWVVLILLAAILARLVTETDKWADDDQRDQE